VSTQADSAGIVFLAVELDGGRAAVLFHGAGAVIVELEPIAGGLAAFEILT